jgi:hypothetical protein
MKQTFDLVSHFFALLPIAVLCGSKKEIIHKIILIFLCFAVFTSFIYHTMDPTSSNYNFFHTVDRFFSCSLVLLTFWLYIDHYKKSSVVVIAIMLVFVLLEAYNVVSDIVVESVLFFFVVLAIWIFLRELVNSAKQKGKKVCELVNSAKQEKNTPESENTPKKYRLKDPFFGSFFITQILAVTFFLWDTPPYYHSLWHLFAFVSLASVLKHYDSEENSESDTALFYLLGSLPSRLFIAWIFIDWHEGEGFYVALVFSLLVLLLLIGLVSQGKQKMTIRRRRTSALSLVAYFCMAIFLYYDKIYVAGWILLCSTLVSGILWGLENLEKLKKCFSRKNNYKPVSPSPTLQLNNMVF